MNRRWQLLPGLLLLLLGAAPLVGQVVIPHSFQAGDTAKSAEVNANFTALKEAVESLQMAHAAALARIESLESDLADVMGNNALTLHGHVAVIPDPNTLNAYTVRFTGVNVQIVNGVSQETPNGTGNLIVGYNNPRNSGWVACSNGQYGNITDCQANGHVWESNFKTGSHNLVLGDRNAYGQTGGLVAGYGNAINRRYSSVSGGENNIAEGVLSSVSGGRDNQALSNYSHIAGGWNNGTQGAYSNVSGGRGNGTTSGATYSSILGGNGNTATTQDQTIP